MMQTMEDNIIIFDAFLIKDAGSPDAWRVGIWKRGNGIIAYATGGTKEYAELHAALIVKALLATKS